jgi:hypothetical protein
MHTHIYSLIPLARSLSRALSLSSQHTAQQHMDNFQMDSVSNTEEEEEDPSPFLRYAGHVTGGLGHRDLRTDYASGDE